ncbi:hypothetical protein SO802_020951 [Lithocarpus litseifolius]|uniref:FCP1 homology domain-containing protein n=1 Tax=Lithocarpus litseifolius TaxID=425828 RepID=A0AAW2CGX9_9ROSI
MDLDQSRAEVHAIMNQSQKYKRRCSKKSDHSMKINDDDLDCQQGSSSMKTTTDSIFFEDSSVAIGGMTESGIPQSNSESKRRKKQNRVQNLLENKGKDCDRPEGTSLLNVTPPEIDPSLQLPVKSCLKLEGEMAQSCMEVSCSQVKIKRREQNRKRSASEINDRECDLQESGTDVKLLEKDDNSVLQLSKMKTNAKDNSVILGEEIKFVKSANTVLMEKHDDDLKNKHVSVDEKNLKTYKRKSVRKSSRRSEKSSASFRNSSESIEDGMGPLFHCSNEEVPTAGLLEKKSDGELLGEHATPAQVVDDILMEEASINCADGEPASRDCKVTSEMKTFEKNSCELNFVSDVSVPYKLKEHLEQKNGGMNCKIQIAGQDLSRVNEDFDEPAFSGEINTADNISGCSPCKHLKKVDVERETKMKGSASSCLVKDDAYLDVIDKEGSLSQISDPSPKRALMDSSRKKLLILDVNGLLLDIVPYAPSGYISDAIISMKPVFKRPFCDGFLQFCFDRFVVGVWSSRTKRNMDRLIDFLLGDSKHKLVFCWDQSHCTSTGFNTIENREKPLLLKELRKLWEKLEPNLPWEKGDYNEANTLLLDDSPYKALANPVNTAIFPHTYRYTEINDTSLGPRGDLRVYLGRLAMAENVQKYVEQNPFGQRAITKSNPSWGFYRKVIDAIACSTQDDASKSLSCS